MTPNDLARAAWLRGPNTSGFVLPVGAPNLPAKALLTKTGTYRGYRALNTSIIWKLNGPSIDGFTLDTIELDGVGMLLRAYDGELSNLVFKNIRSINAIYAPTGRGIFHSASTLLTNLLFSGIYYRCDQPITSENALGYGGFTLASGTGRNIIIEDFDLASFWTAYPEGSTAFKNCDGIAIEPGYADVLIRRGRIADCADACIDLKPKGARVEDVELVNGRNNLKVWNDQAHGAILSRDARFCHILVANGADIVIDYAEFRGAPNVPAVRFENAPGRCTILNVPDDLDPSLVWKSQKHDSKGSVLIVNGVEK